MATLLGVRPSVSPLPVGQTFRRFGAEVGGVAYPPAENYLLPGGANNAGSIGYLAPFNRPERFWLRAGASIITQCTAGGWVRFDYKLRLVVNGAYGNDLNGINLGSQKANMAEFTSHTNPWMGMSIQALYFCEANTNYEVYLLSAGTYANVQYGQYGVHYNLWGYSTAEGVY